MFKYDFVRNRNGEKQHVNISSMPATLTTHKPSEKCEFSNLTRCTEMRQALGICEPKKPWRPMNKKVVKFQLHFHFPPYSRLRAITNDINENYRTFLSLFLFVYEKLIL